MIKVAFVQDHQCEAMRIWNTDDTAESLKSQGFPCESLTLPTDEQKLYSYNVVIFYRSLGRNYTTLINALKNRGIRVGFFIDDLIWDKRFPFAYHHTFEVEAKRLFGLADFYLFTSDFLAKQAPPGKPVLLRRPAILERRFEHIQKTIIPKQNPDFRILISKGHVLPEFAAAMNQIFEKCNIIKPISVHYFTGRGRLYPDKIGHFFFTPIGFLPFDMYLSRIATLKPDLIIVPLPNDDFHNSKCYPKYLEAGTIGSCMLGSSIYPYQKAIKDMETGMLASSPEEFAEKIKWAVENREKVTEMGRKANEDVRQNHLLGPVARQFYEELSKLCEEKPAPVVEAVAPVQPPEALSLVPGMMQNLSNGTFGEIHGSKVISQELICDQENFCRIDVFGSTYRRKNKGQLILTVKEDMSGAPIRTAILDINKLPDNEWWAFEFAPIESSTGRKFCVSIEAKNSSANSAITLNYMNHTFSFGKLYYNNKHLKGCLKFRIFYKF